MSSAVDIQIVSTPNLQKIENFFKDASYRETIEFSANFNTRLCLERRLRLPFFDPQTRIAQNHSQLFMDKRLRMPGFKQGQIYTYPAARWRKSRRQYLNRVYRFPDRPFQGFRKEQESLAAAQSAAAASAFTGTSSPTVIPNATMSTDTNEFNSALLEESSSLGAGGGDTSDSKDSQQQSQQATQKSSQPKDDMSKEWFYDDMDMNDVDSLEDPKSPADDEYDYDPRYGSKKRRKRRAGAGAGGGKRSTMNSGEGMLGGIGGSSGGSGGSGAGRRRSGAGRGRNSLNASLANLTAVSADGVDGGASNSATSLAGAGADVNSTPTSSGAAGGRRQRGTGTRGRRRSKKGDSGNSCDPPSPGLASEPPSFESAAAAVGVSGELSMPDNDLRNYRKYLL